MEFTKPRMGSRPRYPEMRGWLQVEASGVVVRDDIARARKGTYSYVCGMRGRSFVETLTDPEFASLKPGPQTYHYRFHVEWVGNVTFPELFKAKALGNRVIEGTVHWKLLTDDHELTPPALKADEKLRPAVEKCLRADVMRDTEDTSLVSVMIWAFNPPAALGFDVSVRTGGRTRPLGPAAWPAGAWEFQAFEIDLPPEINSFDLVLKPSPAAVAKLQRKDVHRLMRVESIWNGEVVIKNVGMSSQRFAHLNAGRSPVSKESIKDLTEQLEGDDPVIRQLVQDDKVGAAVRQIERDVNADPKNTAAWFNLGCLKFAFGDRR